MAAASWGGGRAVSRWPPPPFFSFSTWIRGLLNVSVFRGFRTLVACVLLVVVASLSAPTRAMAGYAPPTGNTVDTLAGQLNDVQARLATMQSVIDGVKQIATDARDYASYANTNADKSWRYSEAARNAADAAKASADAAKSQATYANTNADLARQYSSAAQAAATAARDNASSANINADLARQNSAAANASAGQARDTAGWANQNADAARTNAAAATAAAQEASANIESARSEIMGAIASLGSLSGGSSASADASLASIETRLGTVFAYAETLPCRLRQAEGSGWWTTVTSVPLGQAAAYGDDADCGLRRGDLREIGRQIAETSDPSELEQLVRDLKGIAEEQIGATQEAAAAAVAAGQAVVQQMQADRAEDASSSMTWRGASGAGLPRLGAWTGSVSCLAVRPPSVASMCGAGPSFDLGHGVVIKPLSVCSDTSVITQWKPLIGAVMVISAVWLAARWLFAALGVAAPNE